MDYRQFTEKCVDVYRKQHTLLTGFSGSLVYFLMNVIFSPSLQSLSESDHANIQMLRDFSAHSFMYKVMCLPTYLLHWSLNIYEEIQRNELCIA